MKSISILLMLLSTMTFADDSLPAKWTWEGGGKTSLFTIEIKEVGGYFIGQYCAVMNSGNKIDCAAGDEQSFKFKNTKQNEYIFDFVSSFSGKTGKAKLSFSNGKLVWQIITEPQGEYYAPSNATLITL